MREFLLLAAAIFVAIVGLAVVIYLRLVAARAEENDRQLYRIVFPSTLTLAQTLAFWRSLPGVLPLGRPWRLPSPVITELVATRDAVQHRLRLPNAHGEAKSILQQLRTAIPGILVEPIIGHSEPIVIAARELRLSTNDRPLRSDPSEATIAAILAGLTGLTPGDRVVVQLLVTPHPPVEVAADAPPSFMPAPAGPWWSWLTQGRSQSAPTPTDREALAARRVKFAGPVVNVVIRVGASRATPQASAEALVSRMVRSFDLFQAPGVRFVSRPWRSSLAARRLVRGVIPVVLTPSVFSVNDLAVACAWPVGSPAVAGLRYVTGRTFPPTPTIARHGLVLAAASYPGQPQPLAVTPAGLTRHAYVLGGSGTGKSTLALSLVTQAIAQGHGVLVIEPSGDLIEQIADRIPDARRQDVIIIDPADREGSHAVGLNLLDQATRHPEQTTDVLVNILKSVASYWGPRLEDTARAAILTLCLTAGSAPTSLVDLIPLLGDAGYRRQRVGQLTDRLGLLPFWAAFEAWSPQERVANLAPLQTRLRSLLLRSSLVGIVGQPSSSFSFDEAIAGRKIVLVSTAKHLLGRDGSALLGSLVLAAAWAAAQHRAALPLQERTPYLAVIDELQDVLSSFGADFPETLVQARKYSFGIIGMNQHLEQLPAAARAALLANTATKVVFGSGADDAARMAREFGHGVTTADILGLGAHEGLFSLAVEAGSSTPVTGLTAPPPRSLGSSRAVRATSRQSFGRLRTEVEEEIVRRHQPPGASSTSNRRRRS